MSNYIDTSGGPATEYHRARSIRDKRVTDLALARWTGYGYSDESKLLSIVAAAIALLAAPAAAEPPTDLPCCHRCRDTSTWPRLRRPAEFSASESGSAGT